MRKKMKHICYIYIKRFKVLENIGVLLDSNFAVSLDNESRTIRIARNENLSKNFWGTGIYSIAGIFGNNGSGKSTTLSCLMDLLLDGSAAKSFDGVLIYESDNNLYVYQNLPGEEFSFECDGINMSSVSTLQKMDVFYYSGHFMPYMNTDDQRCQELKGLYNGSDAIRVKMDLQHYCNLDTFHMRHALFLHLNAYVIQNNYRICMMLANERIRKNFDGFDLPQYVLFAPNNSGRNAWNDKFKDNPQMQLSTFKPMYRENSKLRTLYNFVMLNIQNVLNEIVQKNHDAFVLKWNEIANESEDVLVLLNKYADCWDGDVKGALKEIHYTLDLISKTHYSEQLGAYYLSFTEDKNAVEQLSKSFKASRYLTSKIFDSYYAKNLYSGYTILSSGEQEMLDLFSRIYDAVELMPLYHGRDERPRLLMLDEAEMGYHPEWQRKYLDVLCKFLKSLMVVAGHDFQVILTSHSPLLLSDMPKSACNYLQKIGRTVHNVREDRPETFAGNLYDLMNNNFFLTDFIGQFASDKINVIIEKVNKAVECKDASCLTDLLREINIIGDDYIRGKLLDQLSPLAMIDERAKLQLAMEKKKEEYLELKKHFNNL